MQEPTEIAFRHYEPSDEVRSEIDRQVKRLDKFGPRITSCNVAVIGPQTRRRQGALFKVDLRIAMPERKEIAVSRTHGDAHEREHPLVAIREAFDEAIRQIEDAARQMRGDVKEHAPPESHGRVAKFLSGGDAGFIETPDGREIYFHRHAVLDGAFDRMAIGSEVRFVEEQGENGPQARIVRLRRHSA
ncbi:MAG TPA: HPF/RaiA family ribosome-associated protein [Roseiarcus sp.]|jgi:cold shock CspA family protein|nr:HPF/RaiA family ribosome-associated protein [Roseiarcus sp.]